MRTPGQKCLPLCNQASQSGIERPTPYLAGLKPTHLFTLWTGLNLRLFRRDENISNVVVQMRRFICKCWNLMNIEIERTARGDDQTLNSRFLVRFALRNRKNIFLAIAMSSKL
jgi:hypothetical protein